MSAPASEKLVPIGAAVELLRDQYPDVTHSSLRFLEREGLISSSRTAGGHRLYTQGDIDRVLLIKSWQRQGRSLDDIRTLLESRSQLLDPTEISRQFLELALSSQLEEAASMILQGDRVGMEPQTLFFAVLQPALVRVGEEWASGAISVHQEKEISVLCRELVTEVTLRHTPDYPDGLLLLSACVEGEMHEIGLCMVNGLLRQRGHRVRYLGPDVATVFLIEAIESIAPDAVLLSSSVEVSFPGCLAAVQAIQDRWPNRQSPVILVGGEMAILRGKELTDAGAIPVKDVQTLDALDDLSSLN